MRSITRNMARGLASPLLAVGLLFGAAELGAQEKTDDDIDVVDTTKGRDLDASQKIRVEIRNDLAPARSVIVSVVTLARPEYVLGAVPALGSREFEVDTRLFAGRFRLVATNGLRGTQVSRGIDAIGNARVSWGLGLNFVRVKRLDADGERD